MASGGPNPLSLRDLAQLLQRLQQRDGPLQRALSALRRCDPRGFAAGQRSLDAQIQTKGEGHILGVGDKTGDDWGAPKMVEVVVNRTPKPIQSSGSEKGEKGGQAKQVRLRIPAAEAASTAPAPTRIKEPPSKEPPSRAQDPPGKVTPRSESPPVSAWKTKAPPGSGEAGADGSPPQRRATPPASPERKRGSPPPSAGSLQSKSAQEGIVIAVREILGVQRALIVATASIRALAVTPATGGPTSANQLAMKEINSLRQELDEEREKAKELRRKVRRVVLGSRAAPHDAPWRQPSKDGKSSESEPEDNGVHHLRTPLRWQPQPDGVRSALPVSVTVGSGVGLADDSPPQSPTSSSADTRLPPLLPRCPPGRRRRHANPRKPPTQAAVSDEHVVVSGDWNSTEFKVGVENSDGARGKLMGQVDAAGIAAAAAGGGYENGAAAQGFRLVVSAFCTDVAELLRIFVRSWAAVLPATKNKQTEASPASPAPPPAHQPARHDAEFAQLQKMTPFFAADPVSHRLLTRQPGSMRQWLDEVAMLQDLFVFIKNTLVQQVERV
eukprot:Hpha_TRINITY_DN25911_c0_g1::TRINITY_DN25911_c0_g1_i1::g.185408::m.185408